MASSAKPAAGTRKRPSTSRTSGADKDDRPKKEGPRRTPNWEIWKGRHEATVLQAVCLALNIHPVPGAIKALGSHPSKLLRSHVITTCQWVGLDPELRSRGPSTAKKSRQKIGLAAFIEWLARGRLVGVKPPSQLLRLNPPNPYADPAGAESSGANSVEPNISTPEEQHKREHTQTGTADRLVTGLLITYIKHLAETQKVPPANLVRANRISSRSLAAELRKHVSHRTPLKTASSLDTAGLSPESVRKVLGEAVKRFNADLLDDPASEN